MQAEYLDAPLKMWGQNTRRQQHAGTFGFYVRDYKFTGLWKHPESLLHTGCRVAIEPNFSTSQDMPEAVGIYGIFRKRWLARFWQTHGVRIIVDLNVAEKFCHTNLLGVPDGWQAFATRAQRGSNDLLPVMYDLACEKAGGPPNLFLVYGGGQQVREMCRVYHWLHCEEQMNRWQKHSEMERKRQYSR
jgi:hypothetical protein